MKILAVDTSGEIASISVMESGMILGTVSNNDQKTHSEKLMPLIKNLLDNLKINSNEIDAYAVAIGPGSYTGLRIGVATIKAMAQVHNKPVMPVSTLEGLANNISISTNCALIDARNENVFIGCYGKNKIKDTYMNINEALEILTTFDENITFIGNGSLNYKNIIIDKLKNKAIFVPDNFALQNASSIAKIGHEMFKKGIFSNYFEVKPIYLRENSYVKTNIQ